jgi:hypothetical protein
MKRLLELLFWFVLIVGCAKTDPPAPGSVCQDSNGTGVVGNDNNCYTCTGGAYASYVYLAGYCGSANGAGIYCCSNNYIGHYNVTCNNPSYPYLCSNGLCYSGYQSGLYCVYDPGN